MTVKGMGCDELRSMTEERPVEVALEAARRRARCLEDEGQLAWNDSLSWEKLLGDALEVAIDDSTNVERLLAGLWEGDWYYIVRSFDWRIRLGKALSEVQWIVDAIFERGGEIARANVFSIVIDGRWRPFVSATTLAGYLERWPQELAHLAVRHLGDCGPLLEQVGDAHRVEVVLAMLEYVRMLVEERFYEGRDKEKAIETWLLTTKMLRAQDVAAILARAKLGPEFRMRLTRAVLDVRGRE